MFDASVMLSNGEVTDKIRRYVELLESHLAQRIDGSNEVLLHRYDPGGVLPAGMGWSIA